MQKLNSKPRILPMTTTRKIATAAALSLTLIVGGCGDGGGLAPVDTAAVPDSAGVSVASFIDFILSLSADDETSDPLTISETFAVPEDEINEPRLFI